MRKGIGEGHEAKGNGTNEEVDVGSKNKEQMKVVGLILGVKMKRLVLGVKRKWLSVARRWML